MGLRILRFRDFGVQGLGGVGTSGLEFRGLGTSGLEFRCLGLSGCFLQCLGLRLIVSSGFFGKALRWRSLESGGRVACSLPRPRTSADYYKMPEWTYYNEL